MLHTIPLAFLLLIFFSQHKDSETETLSWRISAASLLSTQRLKPYHGTLQQLVFSQHKDTETETLSWRASAASLLSTQRH